MGFFDRAKKLAEQAKEKAEEALAEAKARSETSGGASSSDRGSSPPGRDDPRLGTPYRPGMLGRPGWRERGLTDPAAVLPIEDRDRAGLPRSTKSQVLEEPFGMGRRWSSGDRSVGLYYQLYPEQRAWQAPGGTSSTSAVDGATTATLEDDRSLVFIGSGDRQVVLETSGLDSFARDDLARAVAAQLAAG